MICIRVLTRAILDNFIHQNDHDFSTTRKCALAFVLFLLRRLKIPYLIDAPAADSYLITCNYDFVGGEAETTGVYAEDLLRHALEGIAGLEREFSVFYHYLEILRSKGKIFVKYKVAT